MVVTNGATDVLFAYTRMENTSLYETRNDLNYIIFDASDKTSA